MADNLRNTIYYEFWKETSNGPEFRMTGTRVLGNNTITTGVDVVPTATLTIPLEDLPSEIMDEVSDGRVAEPRLNIYTIKIFYQVGGVLKYRFIGVVDKMNIDYANYLVTFNLSHRVARMREWLMPANYTIKNTKISHALGRDGAAIGYPSVVGAQTYSMHVDIDYENGAGDTTLEMTFGSNNKLAALTEALKNTEKLHFYVDINDAEGDRIVIGEFGDITGITASTIPFANDDCEPDDLSNFVTLLTEPQYNVDYTNHYNRAVVLCGDVDDGVLHLTLREVYNDKSKQVDGFPVDKYENSVNLQPEPEYDDDGKKINNEKIYTDYDIVAYPDNGNREYYVTDTKQLEEDQGIIFHTVFKYNDLYPIPSLKEDLDGDGEMEDLVITDDDRKEIARRAYLRAVRELKSQRPQKTYQFNCTALPKTLRDGQKINLVYAKTASRQSEDCENEYEDNRVVNINTALYMTKRTITFDAAMNEYATVTLDNELRPRAISAVEVKLRQAVAQNNGGGSNTLPNVVTVGNNNYGENAPSYITLGENAQAPLSTQRLDGDNDYAHYDAASDSLSVNGSAPTTDAPKGATRRRITTVVVDGKPQTIVDYY